MKKITEFCFKNIKYITFIYVLALLIINLFFVIRGDDFHFHMMRLNAIADEYRINGLSAFPIRIYSTVLDGYGYAAPMFYGDIFMHPFALLTFLGISVLSAYRLMKACVLLAIYFICIKVSRKLYDDETHAHIFVAVYMISATIYGNLVGSAIGRSFAEIFAPLAIAGLYMILYKSRKYDWLYLGVGVAGLLFSNVLDCAIVVFSLAVIFIFSIREVDKKKLLKIAKAIVVFIGLTLWFIVPMLEQMSSQVFFVTSDNISLEKNDLSRFTVPLLGLFFPARYYRKIHSLFNFSSPLPISYMSGLIVFIFVAVLAIKHFKKIKKDKFILSILGMLLVFIWFQTKLFPFNLVKSVIGVIQFPYRVGIVMAIIASFLCAKLFEISRNKKTILAVILMSAYFISLNCIGTVGMGVARVILKGEEYMDYSYTMNSIMGAEYLPEKLMNEEFGYDEELLGTHKNKVVCTNEEVNIDFEKSGKYIEISFDNNNGVSKFEVPIIMYKGYEAIYKDTNEILPITSSKNGLVEFESERSAATVQIQYRGTLVQRISDLISLLICVLLLGYISIYHKNQRRTSL